MSMKPWQKDAINVLGIRLEDAIKRLRAQGITPQVTLTCAPRRMGEEGGELRVIRQNEEGSKLVAAAFRIAAPKEKMDE